MGIIPRTATKLKVTFLIDTSSHKKGESTVVCKNTNNSMWSDGKYAYFVGMLRNKDICNVEVLE